MNSWWVNQNEIQKKNMKVSLCGQFKEIKLFEHQNFAWVDKNTIDEYEYPAIDIMYIEKLKEIL